jgi:multidrug efflux pump subunit AcrA (membrane-fusion protein)
MPLSADQKPDRSGLRPHAEVAPPPGPAELIPAARPLPPLGGGLPGRNRRWLRLALALLLVIAAAAGGAWWKLLRPLPVNVVHPWRGEAIEAVYATGVVEAVDTARVGTTISGRIASLLVDEGDRVRRGEVLARLDDTKRCSG